MKVYVIRHGPAGDRETFARSGRPDSERPLTPDGRKKMGRDARGLQALVASFDAIVTSPYVRAAETADIVAGAFDGPRPLKLAALTPDGDPADVLSWLRKHRTYESVAVVGHEPGLSAFVALCVAGTKKPLGELKKGGACLLEWEDVPEPGKARLAWLATARMLRRLDE